MIYLVCLFVHIAAAARAREEEAKAIAAAAAERERLRREAEEQKQRELEAIALAKKLADEETARVEKARLEAEAQRAEAERIERLKHEEEQRIATERAAQKQKEEEEELARNRERERLAAEAAAAAVAAAAAHPEAPSSPMSPPATPQGPIRGSFSLDGIFCGDDTTPSSPSPYSAPTPVTIGGSPDHNSSMSALAALPTVRMIGRNSQGGRERSPSSGSIPLPVSPAAMASLSEGRVTRESVAAANAFEAGSGSHSGVSSPPPFGRGPSASVVPSATPALPLTPEEEEKQKKKAEADRVQRQKVREEITSTEQTYVKSLGILVDQFIHPLKSSDAYDVSQKDVCLTLTHQTILCSLTPHHYCRLCICVGVINVFQC
jgi:flagellar biosynthesis GTPase FlhF